MSALAMWAVYDHPLDYPGKFVARRFEVSTSGPKPTESIIVAPDLETLRNMLRYEMKLSACITRAAQDDPKIVETWL
jgi:hypothetical protein